MLSRLLFIAPLVFYLSCFSQIDQKRLDSLGHAIDSANKNVQAWQDSFTKRQDSIYQSGISKAASDIVKQGQQRTQWQVLIGTAMGLGLIMLLFRRLRRKKYNRQ